MNKNVGKIIKKIRDKKNLSQKRFANKIGVSGKTISAYETGKIMPSYKILEKISRVYDINLMSPIDMHEQKILEEISKIEKALEYLKRLLNIN